MPKRHHHHNIKPNYPDTAKGAVAYLRADSTLDLTNAKAQPDPSVEGVWKITTPNDVSVEFAIVYLCGYRDPFGNVRELDDFECCHRE
jgi:hypothetical protein